MTLLDDLTCSIGVYEDDRKPLPMCPRPLDADDPPIIRPAARSSASAISLVVLQALTFEWQTLDAIARITDLPGVAVRGALGKHVGSGVAETREEKLRQREGVMHVVSPRVYRLRTTTRVVPIRSDR